MPRSPIIAESVFSLTFLITGHLGREPDGRRVKWLTRHKGRWQRHKGDFFLRCQSEPFVTLGFLRRTPLCEQEEEILKDFKN